MDKLLLLELKQNKNFQKTICRLKRTLFEDEKELQHTTKYGKVTKESQNIKYCPREKRLQLGP